MPETFANAGLAERCALLLRGFNLNQLEQYVILCDEYHAQHGSVDAILVGSKKADDLTRTLKYRGGQLKVKTYTDLISDTERRYDNYLKVLDADDFQIVG